MRQLTYPVPQGSQEAARVAQFDSFVNRSARGSRLLQVPEVGIQLKSAGGPELGIAMQRLHRVNTAAPRHSSSVQHLEKTAVGDFRQPLAARSHSGRIRARLPR